MDRSYFDMWAVKKINDPTFTNAFHVTSSTEAMTLCDKLNSMEKDSRRCIDARNRLNSAIHGEGAVIDDLETIVHIACLRVKEKREQSNHDN